MNSRHRGLGLLLTADILGLFMVLMITMLLTYRTMGTVGDFLYIDKIIQDTSFQWEMSIFLAIGVGFVVLIYALFMDSRSFLIYVKNFLMFSIFTFAASEMTMQTVFIFSGIFHWRNFYPIAQCLLLLILFTSVNYYNKPYRLD